MKQLQWDKLSPNAVASTVWGRGTLDESVWSKKLRSQGIFDEMEDDFRMRQTVKKVNRNDAAKLKSVLTDNQRKHIGQSGPSRTSSSFSLTPTVQRSHCSSQAA